MRDAPGRPPLPESKAIGRGKPDRGWHGPAHSSRAARGSRTRKRQPPPGTESQGEFEVGEDASTRGLVRQANHTRGDRPCPTTVSRATRHDGALPRSRPSGTRNRVSGIFSRATPRHSTIPDSDSHPLGCPEQPGESPPRDSPTQRPAKTARFAAPPPRPLRNRCLTAVSGAPILHANLGLPPPARRRRWPEVVAWGSDPGVAQPSEGFAAAPKANPYLSPHPNSSHPWWLKGRRSTRKPRKGI